MLWLVGGDGGIVDVMGWLGLRRVSASHAQDSVALHLAPVKKRRVRGGENCVCQQCSHWGQVEAICPSKPEGRKAPSGAAITCR